jgi:hypothetical protein
LKDVAEFLRLSFIKTGENFGSQIWFNNRGREDMIADIKNTFSDTRQQISIDFSR